MERRELSRILELGQVVEAWLKRLSQQLQVIVGVLGAIFGLILGWMVAQAL